VSLDPPGDAVGRRIKIDLPIELWTCVGEQLDARTLTCLSATSKSMQEQLRPRLTAMALMDRASKVRTLAELTAICSLDAGEGMPGRLTLAASHSPQQRVAMLTILARRIAVLMPNERLVAARQLRTTIAAAGLARSTSLHKTLCFAECGIGWLREYNKYSARADVMAGAHAHEVACAYGLECGEEGFDEEDDHMGDVAGFHRQLQQALAKGPAFWAIDGGMEVGAAIHGFGIVDADVRALLWRLDAASSSGGSGGAAGGDFFLHARGLRSVLQGGMTIPGVLHPWASGALKGEARLALEDDVLSLAALPAFERGEGVQSFMDRTGVREERRDEVEEIAVLGMAAQRIIDGTAVDTVAALHDLRGDQALQELRDLAESLAN
jgi:hypothetical protein